MSDLYTTDGCWINMADANLGTVRMMEAPTEEIASSTAVALNFHAELKLALKDLAAAIDLGKLNIRKDYSLMASHAFATKILHCVDEAEKH